MNIIIKSATEQHLKEYTDLLQKTYEESYTNYALGLTKACFSKEIFASQDTQKYLKGNLQNTARQQCWLAFDKEKLVGSITIKDHGETCELTGFYVDSSYQRKGIGKKLWQKILPFTQRKDITLDLYAHNTKAIEMYKRWGFVIDKNKKEFYRQWPEWPKGLQAKCFYMILKQV